MHRRAAILSLFALLALLATKRSLGADEPLRLGAAAKMVAKDLPRGCIVTAEWINGEAEYSIAGPDQPSGVAAEKIVFEIGSITKTFTGLLLAQAVLEKKLGFETTLRQALDPKQAFADPRVGDITLARLATHTSGLPRIPNNLGRSDRDPYADYDTGKLLAWVATVKLDKAPPHDMSYSNAGIAILGHVLERSLGDSWDNLVRSRICTPLGMHDTTTKPDAEQQKRLAPPFKGEGEAHPWNFKAFAAAGALRSTAADMMIYARALNSPEKTPLHEAIRLAVKPLAEGIGCCFFLNEGTISHGGGTGGYRTQVQATPMADHVRIVLINNAEFDDTRVLREIERRGFKAVAGPKPGEEELRAYLGVFQLDARQKFTFILRNGQLWGKLTGQSFFPYIYEKDDTFFHKPFAVRLIFERDAEARVVAVTLDQNNRKTRCRRLDEEPAAYVFRDARELQEYTGTYEFANFTGVLTIRLRGSTLFARLSGQDFLPVFETKKDRFEYDVVAARLEFERDEAGKIIRLHLHQNGRKLPALKREK